MKKTYILISTLFILVIIAFVILVLSNKKNVPPQKTLPVPTPIIERHIATPTPTTGNIFENKTVKKELDLLENRRQLSASDAATKKSLINSIATNSSTIYHTNEYSVIYIRSLDEIQIEVTTINTQQAMLDSVNWLESQGISHDGICKLPLTFFTTSDVYQQLKSQGKNDIPPLAAGC